MADQVAPDSVVEYTVKELLDEQTGLLRGIDKKVDGKADRADVVALGTRLDTIASDHGTRIDSLEDHRKEIEQSRTFRRRAWAVAATVGGILAVLGGSLIAALVH